MKDYNAQIVLWEHAVLLVREIISGYLSVGDANEVHLSGRGFLLVRGKAYSVSVNGRHYGMEQYSLFHAGADSCMILTAGNTSVSYTFVRYDAEFLPDCRGEMLRLVEHHNPFDACFHIVPDNPLIYGDLFTQMEECWRNTTALDRLRIKAIMDSIVYELHKQMSNGRKFSSCIDCFEVVRGYLDKHYMESITLQTIADMLQTSYSTINRTFHQQVGMSAQQYLMNLRFDAAKRALRNSDMTLNDIAISTGFQDKAYFSRVFKEKHGITPNEWRRINCDEQAKSRASKSRPLVISNFHHMTEYREIPERIVCLSIPEAEICAALGLADRIAAMAVACGSLESCEPEYRDMLLDIPVISSEHGIRGQIRMQDILVYKPDFVYGTANRFISRFGIAPVDSFISKGINVYVSSATYELRSSIDNVYNDILNISRIFDVQEKGIELVSRIQIMAEQIIAEVGVPSSKARVFVMDAEIHGMAYTAGMSLETELIRLAGGENVFGNIPSTFELVDWQCVKEADPEYIIVHEFWPERKTEEKIQRLLSMDVLKNVSAIQNKRIKVIRLADVFPSIHVAETLKVLTEWFKKG